MVLIQPDAFESFGDLLVYLRKRVRLTQDELGGIVGYSRAQITRLENNQRSPDLTTVIAMFIPALELDDQPGMAKRLLELAARARGSQRLTFTRAIKTEISERVEYEADAPAARTGRSGAPIPLMPLIGRERELAITRERILDPDTRLLTLVGPPGVGKTRLAVQLAIDAGVEFADGVCFVSLAALMDPTLVPAAITQSLGVTNTNRGEESSRLLDALGSKQLLLVLDNFEQILDAAPLISDILMNAGKVKILVTSRSPLHLYGEYRFPVPPLSLPELANLPPTEELSQFPSVALFIARAQAVKPDFVLTCANALAVAAICVRLDGLPLAIELAAAQSNLFTPQTLLRGLIEKQPVLSKGPRNMPERHHSLTNAIAWSYRQLDPNEQKLFTWLGIFLGGFAISSVSSLNLVADIDSSLAILVDKSLVLARIDQQAETRFILMETIREFALEQLSLSKELGAAQRWHAEHFMALAERAELELSGTAQAEWLSRLEQEHGNIHAALQWAHESKETETGLRLVAALWRFWTAYGHLNEGRGWCATLLADAGEGEQRATPRTRARALYTAGVLASDQSDYANAVQLQEQSLELQRMLGDRLGIARSLNSLGLIASSRGEYSKADILFEESLQIRYESNDTKGAGHCLNNLGRVAMSQGKFEHAITYFEQSILIYRKVGPEQSLVNTLNNLGLVVQFCGDMERAEKIHEEALAIGRRLGNKRAIAFSLYNLARITAERRDWQRTKELASESLQLNQSSDYREQILDCLELWARVESAQDNPEAAARLLGAAEAWRETIGAPLDPCFLEKYRSDVMGVKAQLDEQSFARAWRSGRLLSLDEAISIALTSRSWLTKES